MALIPMRCCRSFEARRRVGDNAPYLSFDSHALLQKF